MAVKYSGCAGKIHSLFEAFTEIGIETHPEAGVVCTYKRASYEVLVFK